MDEALEAAAYFVRLPQPANWKAGAKAAFASPLSRLGRQLATAWLWGGSDSGNTGCSSRSGLVASARAGG